MIHLVLHFDEMLAFYPQHSEPIILGQVGKLHMFGRCFPAGFQVGQGCFHMLDLFSLVRRMCGLTFEIKPQSLGPAGGERGGHLPPRHPRHFQDERGDSALSRLGAQRTPAGLGLDRVGAPCYRPHRTKKRCIGLGQRPIPIHLLESNSGKHTETMRCDAERCR